MDEGFQEFRNCRQKASFTPAQLRCGRLMRGLDVCSFLNLLLRRPAKVLEEKVPVFPRHPQTFMLGETLQLQCGASCSARMIRIAVVERVCSMQCFRKIVPFIAWLSFQTCQPCAVHKRMPVRTARVRGA